MTACRKEQDGKKGGKGGKGETAAWEEGKEEAFSVNMYKLNHCNPYEADILCTTSMEIPERHHEDAAAIRNKNRHDPFCPPVFFCFSVRFWVRLLFHSVLYPWNCMILTCIQLTCLCVKWLLTLYCSEQSLMTYSFISSFLHGPCNYLFWH